MRSHEARLRKLEAMRPTTVPDNPAFWMFGHCLEDMDCCFGEEVKDDQARSGLAYPVIWRGDDPVPPARWAKPSDLTPEENEDWVATLMLIVGGEPRPRGDVQWPLHLPVIMDAIRAEIDQRAAS